MDYRGDLSPKTYSSYHDYYGSWRGLRACLSKDERAFFWDKGYLIPREVLIRRTSLSLLKHHDKGEDWEKE